MQCTLERAASSSRACSANGLSPSPAVSLRKAPSSRCCCPPAPSSATHHRQLPVVAAYAPSLPTPSASAAMSASAQLSSTQPRTSLDPQAKEWEQAWEPGRLVTVKSPEQFEELQKQHPEQLVVLMCKSHACRPCKMFTRKYLAIAQRFPDCILAEIYGDETPDTRKMMMQMDVRVTPTFRMYRHGDFVNVTTGTQEKKLMRGILSAMTAAELASHQQEIADTMSLDEADQQPAAAAAPAGGSS